MNSHQVTALQINNLQVLRPILAKEAQTPYRFLLNNFHNNEPENYSFQEISDIINTGQGKVFICLYKEKIVGVIVYADLPWETRIIQKRMGAIKYFLIDHDYPQRIKLAESLLDHLIKWTIYSEIDFLLCKVFTNDLLAIHSLEMKGFLLMDTMLDYVYDNRMSPFKDIPKPSLQKDVTLRLARQDDEGDLLVVAQKSFEKHFGRFHADEKIKPSQATEIYKEWIKSSLAGYGDYIVVTELKDEITGFSVWKKPSVLEQKFGIRMGHHSLIGIGPDHQGKGLFGIHAWEGMNLLNDQVRWIDGHTHPNNYPVQRGLTKLSWKIYDARHSFHKWIKS